MDGRFVRSVQLDNGFLRVDPPPAGAVPQLSKETTDLLWASSAFQGKDAVTVGYGLITLGLAQQGIEKVESQPGWIAFATGGSYNCPIMTAAPSPADLPSGGYVAVSLVEGIANFAYTAASDVCGHVTDPAVGMARHVESVPWEQVGAVSNGRVVIRYTPPACAIDAAYDVSGNGDVYTLAVDMSVANDPLPCTFTQPVKTSVTLTQGSGGTVTELQHAPEGLVRQAQGVT